MVPRTEANGDRPGAPVTHTQRTRPRTRTHAAGNLTGLTPARPGAPVATSPAMVWFLERDSERMACEVRRASDGAWEYEATSPCGESELIRFPHATPLIESYLKAQRELRRQGWRPRTITFS